MLSTVSIYRPTVNRSSSVIGCIGQKAAVQTSGQTSPTKRKINKYFFGIDFQQIAGKNSENK